MATVRGLRLRKSFLQVEKEHYEARRIDPKAVTELELLILAFRGIQDLSPSDPNSFWIIAGYHGEPFRGAGWSNAMWWGGYCYHGSILFPTWHRAYIKRLEDALRSIPGCGTVTLPFLDWCDETVKADGLPSTFTSQGFELSDGTQIKNPLYSYTFQKGVFTNLTSLDGGDYSKIASYETVRFPYSGLVGTKDVEKTEAWNKKFPYPTNVAPLNDNVKDWLHSGFFIGEGKDKKWHATGTAEKFRQCLNAPNYTVFSNTSSAQQYNQETLNTEVVPYFEKTEIAVPLESPHNDMHLAMGGFSIPGQGTFDRTGFEDANGDMGENDTASFDPIFFFHHCFIDRMFWLWQLKQNQINELKIAPEFMHYPGTNNFDGQGPTPGRPAGEWISLSTPLDPFVKADGTSMISLDVVNVETQLGYTYGPGSFTSADGSPLTRLERLREHPAPPHPAGAMAISGLNRGTISGSFMVTVTEDIPNGGTRLLGSEAVLSRWHTSGCANCQTHLNVKMFIPLPGIRSEDYHKHNVNVQVHTRKNRHGKKLRGEPMFRAPKIASHGGLNGH